jgi:serine/threonine protein kinase
MPNTPPASRGPELFDDVPGYRLLEQVGRGGFGVVYRAYQEHLGRDVAVKVLTVTDADARTMERFQRECRLTGSLTGHPNVVTVLDSGITRTGRAYLAMAYFERGSLAERLARDGALPVHEVLRIGVKIAGALAAAHAAGILHRDVKPQNILVSRYGEPALADFGIARLLDTVDVSTRTDALTPYHAAPEVLEGQPSGETADIYSLGSTLYQLLAGRPAFKRDTSEGIASLLLRIVSEPPPDIPRPDIPPQVMEAIRQALAKRPAERFPQASAFAARIQQVQAELWMPVTELPRGPSDIPAVQPVGRELLPEPPTLTRTPPAPPVAAPPARSRQVPEATGPAPAPRPGTAARNGPAGLAARDSAGERGLSAAERTPPDPDLAETALRPGRAIEGHPPPPERRRHGVAIGLALAVLIAAMVVGVGLAVSRSAKSPPSAGGKTSRTSPAPSVPASKLNAARPVDLQVIDDGASAVLTWKVPPGDRYPLAMQRSAPGVASSLQLISGTETTTTATATGLDPGKGYCFRVGAVVVMANPSTVAWSQPACIRGATAAAAP